MLSDDELVEQILLGNENAAEELIKRYYTYFTLLQVVTEGGDLL